MNNSNSSNDDRTTEMRFTEYFDFIFTQFLSQNNHPSILVNNKTRIFQECRKKLKDEILKGDPETAKDELLQILKTTIHSYAYIPEGLIGDSDELEADIVNSDGEISDFNIIARNVFRYIVRGTEIDGARPDLKTGLAFVERTLAKERNPKLSKALREEFQNIITNIGKRLIDTDILTEGEEEHYNILISNLLAAYTFLDPQEEPDRILIIPQKIEGLWQNIDYKIQALDLSPQRGLLSNLIKDKDRIFAYGLTPLDPNIAAKRHLLLMGTTYPSGQGAAFSTIHKFDPNHSVGEGYDWTYVDQWLNEDPRFVKTTGHSQGGTSAMYVAAKFPKVICEAHCLNPTALCTATLDRISPQWLDISPKDRPRIHVYAQQGDPVYPLENGFLEGTRVFHIISGVEKCSSLNPWLPSFFQKTLEAHLHHFVGRSSSLILELDTRQEGFTYNREFFADMKGTLNWVLYPFLYFDLITKLVFRNSKDWALEHCPKALVTTTEIIGFLPCHALKFAFDLTLALVQSVLLFTTLLLTAAASGTKIGLKSLCDTPSPTL